MLHSKSGGDRAVLHLPPRSKTSLRLRGEDKQIPRVMKSHDFHVLMTQILPVAIRGIMYAHVRETLFGLCNFFDWREATQKATGRDRGDTMRA